MGIHLQKAKSRLTKKQGGKKRYAIRFWSDIVYAVGVEWQLNEQIQQDLYSDGAAYQKF